MLLIIGIFIFVTMLGYMFPKSKLIFVLETLAIIILVGGYDGNTDLIFYRYDYIHETTSNEFLEGVYNIIAIGFHHLGISFEIFHLVITAFAIGGIAYVVYKLSPEPAFVMSTMAGFSTFEYAPQIKAMCASSITILAIYYLFKLGFNKGEKKKQFVYFSLIIIACGFHFISLFFLVLLLIPYVKREHIKYWVMACGILILVLIPTIENIAGRYITGLSIYLGNYRDIEVFLGMCAWQLSGVVLIYLIYKKLLRKTEIIEDVRKQLLIGYIYKGSIVMLLAMPFYSITTVMMRVVRTWSVFYYIMASYIETRKNVVSVLKCLVVLYSIGSLVLFYILLVSNRENILWDVLSNNIFW